MLNPLANLKLTSILLQLQNRVNETAYSVVLSENMEEISPAGATVLHTPNALEIINALQLDLTFAPQVGSRHEPTLRETAPDSFSRRLLCMTVLNESAEDAAKIEIEHD